MTTRKARAPELAKYRDIIRRMAEQGATDGRIAEYLGATEGTIQFFRARHGIPSGKSQRKRLSPEEREALRENMPAPTKPLAEDREREWARLLGGQRFEDDERAPARLRVWRPAQMEARTI